MMELRRNPRPRRLDPDFVSSPPRTPPRKRARKHAAAEKPSKRARCAGGYIGSPVVGLQPSRCLRLAAPVARASSIPRSRVPFNWYALRSLSPRVSVCGFEFSVLLAVDLVDRGAAALRVDRLEFLV
jgi:hypothetical protein